MRKQQRLRFKIAQMICRHFPPRIALRIGRHLYSRSQAYKDNYSFTVRSQTGSVYRGHTSDFHSYWFAVYGYTALRNWAVAAALCRKGDVIIEVGANVGTETIAFSDIVGPTGKVYAFEPYSRNITILKDALSTLRYNNVEVIPFAIGNTCGTVSFAPPPDHHSSGIGFVTARAERFHKGPSDLLEVPCVTLDSIMAKVPNARMIFIDVEGFEPFVLRGARHYLQKHQSFIFLEAKPKWLERSGATLQSLYDELTTSGYRVFDTKGTRFTLTSPDLHSKRGTDWLCLPESEVEQVRVVDRYMKQIFNFPFIFNLNPLSRV